MRKKVDGRIQRIIENCQQANQRGVFVIIGDRARDVVVNIHFLTGKMGSKRAKKLLWCYNKELGFSSHKKKKMKEITANMKAGNYDSLSENPFDLFLTNNDIQFCYYRETQNVLGNTYSALILQDFEGLNPNVLCRTVETVQGGGLIFILVKSLTNLKQLYTMAMDVHKRFRTESHQDVEPRFNERFILSLCKAGNCLFMDDEMNLLTVSSQTENIAPVPQEELDDLAKKAQELEHLKTSLKDNPTIGPLIGATLTLDQAKALLVYADVLQQKKFVTTVFLEAARGRGKSAAMGFGLAAALAKGISSIFVTAPSPENLTTFFEFTIKGLELLGFKQSVHFEVIRTPIENVSQGGEKTQDSNAKKTEAVTRLNFYATHKQIVQYFDPVQGESLHYAELLIIDEAAAIPLPLVKKMLGRCPVFISSTVHGYEGTGRSLSLKLIKQLRQASTQEKGYSGELPFREVKMEEPIRYSLNDPIEKWLYDLLLLDANKADPLRAGLPHPSECQLYLVNKDTLFSYNKSAEKFLRKVYSLFVASHYKNSPNDLQLLSDAPAHSILVLLGNLKEEGSTEIPDILCAVQVALEGDISQEKVVENSSRGIKPSGDLLPWTVSEQFMDREFPRLNGLRVVRIATHPQTQGKGYGSRTLELLKKFFSRELVGEEELVSFYDYSKYEEGGSVKDLHQSADLRSKKKLKPLLKSLSEIAPPKMHYLGTSFGLTPELFNFWKKNDYHPVYLKQKPNELTGEYSCIMLQELGNRDLSEGEVTLSENWLQLYRADFEKRFSSLLSFQFSSFELKMCMEILSPRLTSTAAGNAAQEDEMEDELQGNTNGAAGVHSNLTKEKLSGLVSLLDLKRLESYSNNLIDFYLIRDLIPAVSRLFYHKQLPERVRLSYSQAAILVGFGLQHREIESVSKELDMEVGHVLALFSKSIKKIAKSLREVYEKEIRDELASKEKRLSLNPLNPKIGAALEEEGKKVIAKMNQHSGPNDEELNETLLKKRTKAKEIDKIEKKSKLHKFDDKFALDVKQTTKLDPSKVVRKGSSGQS